MNKNAIVVAGIIILALIAGATYMAINNGEKEMMNENPAMQNEESDMMNENEAGGNADDMMDEKSGSYEIYSPDKLVRAETGDVVLFFYASWCPSCRGLNADIEKNLTAIPAGTSILRTDYDSESELKKGYGITYQHTLVQVNSDGTMIKKWSGSPTLSRLVAEIQ